MLPLDRVTLVYISENNEEYRQPLSDLPDMGTLIDPDNGNDLDLIGVELTGDQ